MEESNTFRSSLDAVARAYGMEDIDRHGSDQDVYQRVADVAKRSEEGRGFAGGRRRDGRTEARTQRGGSVAQRLR